MMSVLRFAPPVVALALVLVGLPPPAALASVTGEAVLVIDGRGNGHGVGLSQDGALAMGRSGSTVDEILVKFYPGTEKAAAGGAVGVRVLETADRSAEVAFPGGGEVRANPDGPQPDGFPVRVRPMGTATIFLRGGAFYAESDDREVLEVAMPAVRLIVDETSVAEGTPGPPAIDEGDGGPPTTSPGTVTSTTIPVDDQPTTTTSVGASSTTTTPVPESTTVFAPPATSSPGGSDPPPPGPAPAEGLWLVPSPGSVTALPARDRSYRGVVEVVGSHGGGIGLVNRVDVEDYLRGMGEVLDPSWPPASLQAQAVAARTYALRATQAGGTLCDDDRCQVYLGAQVEYPAMDAAVEESTGQVLVFEGGLASTVYSASAGGVTATPREGFGTDGSGYPYLLSTPYAASDPPVWSTTIGLDDLGRRLDYPGRVREATVTASGPSGRVLEVVLDGDAGRRPVEGLRFASRMNLDSTLFSLRAAIGTPAASTTSGGAFLQAPPDAAGSLPPLPGRSLIPAATTSTAGHAVRSALLLLAAGLLLVHWRRRLAAARGL